MSAWTALGAANATDDVYPDNGCPRGDDCDLLVLVAPRRAVRIDVGDEATVFLQPADCDRLAGLLRAAATHARQQ